MVHNSSHLWCTEKSGKKYYGLGKKKKKKEKGRCGWKGGREGGELREAREAKTWAATTADWQA